MHDSIEKILRVRGGSSMPCPVCGANSRVLKTRRIMLAEADEPQITRARECLKKHKPHRFKTVEKIYKITP